MRKKCVLPLPLRRFLLTGRLRLGRVFRRRGRRGSRAFRARPYNCRWGQNENADFRVWISCCATEVRCVFLLV